MIPNPYPTLIYILLGIFIPASIWSSIKKSRWTPIFGVMPWSIIAIDQAKRASDALLLQHHSGTLLLKIMPPWFAMSGLFVPGLILALVLVGTLIVIVRMVRAARKAGQSVVQFESTTGAKNAWKLFGVPVIVFYAAMCWWNQFALRPIVITDQGIVHGRTYWNISAEFVSWEKIKSHGAVGDKGSNGQSLIYKFTFVSPDGSEVTRQLMIAPVQENEIERVFAEHVK